MQIGLMKQLNIQYVKTKDGKALAKILGAVVYRKTICAYLRLVEQLNVTFIFLSIANFDGDVVFEHDLC